MCPGLLGATMITSTKGGGMIWWKWMLKPWAKKRASPSFNPGLMHWS